MSTIVVNNKVSFKDIIKYATDPEYDHLIIYENNIPLFEYINFPYIKHITIRGVCSYDIGTRAPNCLNK